MKTRLTDTLMSHETRSDQLRVRDWLVAAVESRRVSVGVRGDEVGGVYAPPRWTQSLSGVLTVLWADGLMSRTSLSRPLLDEPEQLLTFMRESAYDDLFAPDIPEVQEAAVVKVYSQGAASTVDQDPSTLFSSIALARETFRALNTRNCSAVIESSLKQWTLASSRGLNVRFDTTCMEFSAMADSLYSIEVVSRELVPLEAVNAQLAHLSEMVAVLRKRIDAPPPTNNVILLPPIALRFVDHYLVTNLDAERIHEGRSAFRAEDLAQEKPLFHESLSLTHDPCRPFSAGSYPMDGQGLGARAVDLIRCGRLAGAHVSLRGARQTGWAPTPCLSPEGLVLKGASSSELFETIKKTEIGFVVQSALGLHTQDPGRGDYSVAVPHGILILDGKMCGAVKGLLVGNFFEDLAGEAKVLDSPLHSFAGLAFKGNVKF